jgi:hypothetical protein
VFLPPLDEQGRIVDLLSRRLAEEAQANRLVCLLRFVAQMLRWYARSCDA